MGNGNQFDGPLPKGEVRDIPADAKVHVSVLKRMQEDQNFRPGNLICLGEGGRGMRIAPPEKGMGEWVEWDDGGKHDVKKGEIFVSKAWAEGQASKSRVEATHDKRGLDAMQDDKSKDTHDEKVTEKDKAANGPSERA